MKMIGWTILSGIWWTLGIALTTLPDWARIVCFVMALLHMLVAVWKEDRLESRIDELAIALERHKNNSDD